MHAMVNFFKLGPVTMLHVRLGQIGQAGVNVLLNVTGELDLDQGLVPLVISRIVKDLQLMNNYVIGNRVDVK